MKMSPNDQKMAKDEWSTRASAEQFCNSNEDRPRRNVNVLEGTLATGILVALGGLKSDRSGADAGGARGLEKRRTLRGSGRNTGGRNTRSTNDMAMLVVPTYSRDCPRDHGVESPLAATMTTMITSDGNIISDEGARIGVTEKERRRMKGGHGCVIIGDVKKPEGIMTRAQS